MSTRRRSGCDEAARVGRKIDRPRMKICRGVNRAPACEKPAERAPAKNTEWMKPLDEESLRALKAGWGFANEAPRCSGSTTPQRGAFANSRMNSIRACHRLSQSRASARQRPRMTLAAVFS